MQQQDTKYIITQSGMSFLFMSFFVVFLSQNKKNKCEHVSE